MHTLLWLPKGVMKLNYTLEVKVFSSSVRPAAPFSANSAAFMARCIASLWAKPRFRPAHNICVKTIVIFCVCPFATRLHTTPFEICILQLSCWKSTDVSSELASCKCSNVKCPVCSTSLSSADNPNFIYSFKLSLLDTSDLDHWMLPSSFTFMTSQYSVKGDFGSYLEGVVVTTYHSSGINMLLCVPVDQGRLSG